MIDIIRDGPDSGWRCQVYGGKHGVSCVFCCCVNLSTFGKRCDDFRKYYINLTSPQVYMSIDDAHHKFPEEFSFT